MRHPGEKLLVAVEGGERVQAVRATRGSTQIVRETREGGQRPTRTRVRPVVPRHLRNINVAHLSGTELPLSTHAGSAWCTEECPCTQR